MKAGLIIACAIACATPACVKVKPQITRRYNTQTTVAVDQSDTRLSVFAMEVPSESARTTLLNLSERGQASLVRELGTKTKDAPGLLAALGKSIRAPANPERESDRTVVQRRLIFSVENISPGYADRINLARVAVDRLSGNAEFQDWTQFATKYETADLGTLKFNRSREFDLDLTFDPTHHVKELAKAEATSKNSEAVEENVSFHQRYVTLTGSLAPDKAVLIQQGVPGIDLTGNMAVDLTVKVNRAQTAATDTFAFDDLLDDAGAPKPAPGITISRKTTRYVTRPAVDIPATATLIATVRAVTAGDDTLTESDDTVQFRRGPAPSVSLTLIPKEALQFSVWLLRDGAGNALAINAGSTRPETLQMEGFDDAGSFRDYLKKLTDPSRIGGRALTLNGSPLTAASAASLQVSIEKLNW